MSVVNNVLKSVPRNSDGFEDVDSFWNTSDKLVFPVADLPKLFSSAKPATTPSKSTPQKTDSDIEFNYDTSPDISDEEEDDDEEEESESDNDKDDNDDIPSPDGASTKTGRSKSILSSGAKSSRSSIQSTVYSPLNASLQSVGVSPLGTTNGSIRQSLESGIDGSDISGRESILSRGTPTTSGGSTRNSINPGSSSKKSVANSTSNTTINTSNNISRNSSVDTSIDTSANTTNNTSHNASTKSGTNSSVNTSATSRRASDSGLDLISPAGRSLNESSFFADRSGDMNETGAISEFGFGQKPPTSVAKGRRASTNGDSLASPGSAAKASSTSTASASALPSATKGGRSGGDRAGLRVSFGNQSELANLSPIEASGLGSVDTGASKRSQSRNSSHNTSLNASLDLSPADTSVASSANSKNTSRNTTKNTTINSSRNTSRNTTATSVRSSGTKEASSLQQSRDEEGEGEQDRDNDSFGDYANDYDEPEDFDRDEEQGEEDEPSRLASQTDTPTTNRSSFSRSGVGLNDSELRTPYSEANTSNSSRGSARTPSSNRRGDRGGGSMSMISTPGSNEFVRGYHMPDPDATVMNELSTDEEDEDLDETGVSTPEVGRKKGGKQSKKHTVTDGEDELNTTTNPNEVTTTFIDLEYLHTIGSSNKKYVKAREELKKRRPKVSKPRRTQLYHSSDEEDGGVRRGSSEEEEEEQDSEEEGGRRRSKRATKGQRFQFWKGERPIYEKGTLVEIHAPDPTPQKRKRPTAKVTEDGKAAKRAKKATRADHSDDNEEEEEHAVAHKLPPVRVPKNVKYLARDEIETLEIWDEVQETQGEEKVFCTAESLLPPVALPRTAKRQPGRDKVGFAAHSFNVQEVPNTMSGWLSGFIDLPPDAIKDAEGVGRFTQVFFVSDCQDGALELGLANPSQDEWVDRTAQRVLLKKGDCFYVPPGNIYRLENHSTVKSSKLNWVIIKPLEQNNLDDGEADEGSVVSGASLGESPNTTGALLDGRAGRRAPISVEEDM